MPPRQKDPLRLADQWCDSPELHACSTSSCRLGRGQVSACQLRPAPACVQVARGPEMEGDGASMPLPSAGGTTDAPSGSKSGGIKGFFSKLGGGRKVTKPDAPVAAAAVPAGVEKLASVPTAGKFFFSCIVWLCLCIDTSERLVVKVLAACAGAQMPSSSGPGFREMLVDPNDESAAPTKFTGGSMPSGGTVFVWEGTGPMPAGGPPVPGPDGSLPAGWKKVEWDGTGPPPPELSGAPAAAVGATYPWQGSGPMPAGGPGFTGGSMPSMASGGTMYTWAGSGPIPTGGPPAPGPDGSLPAGWKKVDWDGTGPTPPELSGVPLFKWESHTTPDAAVPVPTVPGVAEPIPSGGEAADAAADSALGGLDVTDVSVVCPSPLESILNATVSVTPARCWSSSCSSLLCSIKGPYTTGSMVLYADFARG